MTHGQGNQVGDQERVICRLKKKNNKNSLLPMKCIVLLITMQMLPIGLHAQSRQSVYDFIKENYYSYKADSVAKIQVQDLINDGLKGDSLYHAQSLIAHTNQKIGNYKEVLNRLKSIPKKVKLKLAKINFFRKPVVGEL